MRGPARTPDTAFWVDRADVDDEAGRLRLSVSESRHLLRVFRATPPTPFEAVDGQGFLYRCVLESADAGIAAGRIESRVENAGELPASLNLLIGLPDPPQLETVVSLAVPLGATRIDFVATARSDRGALPETRLERLSRIARSALKQSRRTRLPVLTSSDSLEGALGTIAGNSLRFLADPTGEALRTLAIESRSGAESTPQLSVIVAVGPPGGFVGEEIDFLRSRDFHPISLGPSRLSTSTAAIALLATLRNSILSMGLGRVDKTGLPGYLH